MSSLRRRLFCGTLGITALTWLLSGCQSVPLARSVPLTGDALIDNNAELAVAPPKDRALWEYRVAAVALRRDRFDEAKAKLDDALALAAANFGNSNSEAAKSRRLFRRESDKPFIGEPYERVMADYYRGILYWRDGEPDNARALFRSAQLIDSGTEDKTYSSDYILLDYLDGYASAKLGGDGSDALGRARANAKLQHRARPPNYDLNANVMVFVEYGPAPRKYAGGDHGEQLKFFTERARIVSAEIRVDGHNVKLPPYDDLNFQATTRGGRVMDHILGNKAVFKQRTDAVGDAALLGAVVAANHGSRDSERAAVGLAAVGLLSKLASSATTPSADIRTWDNLPQYLSFAALRLKPGEYPATLMFFDTGGAPIQTYTQQFTITVPAPDVGVTTANPPDTVVFRSAVRN